jgi:enamine deaminase RidA (YjgF/YER057c/UK114 family)
MPHQVRYLNPPTLSVPTGYSHVAEVSGGRTIYIAGQVAFDNSGKVVGKGDFAAQATQVFENLKLALAAVGATFENVVKVNTYVTDMSHLPTLREIRGKYYGKFAPASTLVEIGKLAHPDLMVEIEAVAVVA